MNFLQVLAARSIAAAAVVGFLISSSAAVEIACFNEGFKLDDGQETLIKARYLVNRACGISLRDGATGGALLKAEIVKPPTIGEAKVLGLSSYAYRSTRVGADKYTVKIEWTYFGGAPRTSLLTVMINVVATAAEVK